MKEVRVMLFHGSFAEPFIERFHMFSHFGTRQAAMETLAAKYYCDGETGIARIYTVFVPEGNYLSVEDLDAPEPNVWRLRLMSSNVIDFEEGRKLQKLLYAYGMNQANRLERYKVFGEWLANRGYDGFRYINQHEHVGSESIAIADPDKLRITLCEVASQSEIDATWKRIQHRFSRCRQII